MRCRGGGRAARREKGQAAAAVGPDRATRPPQGHRGGWRAGTRLEYDPAQRACRFRGDLARVCLSVRHFGRRRGKCQACEHSRNVDCATALTEAQRFAEWLHERVDQIELPQLISWIEGCKPREVIAALRRESTRRGVGSWLAT